MSKLLVLVEGQTEEIFVRDILGPHLATFNVSAIPVLLKTKRVKAGGAFRGGVTSTEQVLGDLRRLLGDSAANVTTVIDYYGLPDDFPGMQTRPSGDPYVRVRHVEEALRAVLGARKFIPHLVLHEYEAWVFASPEDCSWVFDDPLVVTQLAGIATTANGPELINDGPTTAPSKRLMRIFPGYRKTLHGPMAVGATGLARLRQACPHAATWLDQLESL